MGVPFQQAAKKGPLSPTVITALPSAAATSVPRLQPWDLEPCPNCFCGFCPWISRISDPATGQQTAETWFRTNLFSIGWVLGVLVCYLRSFRTHSQPCRRVPFAADVGFALQARGVGFGKEAGEGYRLAEEGLCCGVQASYVLLSCQGGKPLVPPAHPGDAVLPQEPG